MNRLKENEKHGIAVVGTVGSRTWGCQIVEESLRAETNEEDEGKH